MQKNTNQLTTIEKITVKLWRHLIMPTIEIFGNKKYPVGRLIERTYGELKDEKLDILLPPQGASLKSVPVVHIHGGGWICGSKGEFYARPLLKFSNAGYPVFSINYPLAPEHPHPNILKSLLKALVWIKKEYPSYSEIHLIGDSAGGNLAMMLGILLSNPNPLEPFENIGLDQLPSIKSITPIYAIFDRFSAVEDGFPSVKVMLKAYGGIHALDKNYFYPIPFVPMEINLFNKLPSTFIVGAGDDALLRSSKIYAKHLQARFSNVDFKIYPKSKHGFFSFGLGCDELSSDILKFFEQF